MYRLACLFCVLILAVLIVSCAKETTPKFPGVYGQAMTAIDEFRFPQADSLLAAANAKDSLAYLGTYIQGISFERQFLFYDALQSYLVTVSRNPDSGAAYAGLCRTYSALNAPYEAAEAAGRWLKRDSTNSTAQLWMVRSLIEGGSFSIAEAALKDARRLGIDKGVGDLLQARLQAVGLQYDDAAKSATESASQGSKSGDYYLAMADYLEQAGLVDSAIWAGGKSYEVSGDELLGYFNLQRCLRHKYFSAARGYISKLTARDKSQIPSLVATLWYKIAASDLNQLTRQADQLMARCANLYSPEFVSLAARLKVGDLQMANQNVFNIHSYYEMKAVYPAFRSFVHWELLVYNPWPYTYKEVMGQLDSLRGWREALPRFQAEQAAALLADSTRQRFFARVDSLLNANAGIPYWLESLGRVFSESPSDRESVANRVYRFTLTRYPESIEARLGLIQNLIADFRFDEALTQFSQAPQFTRYRPEAGLLKALCEAKLGKATDAVQSFEQSYPAVKGNITIVNDIVQELLRRQQGSQAQQIVSRCLELAPKDGDAHMLASDLQYQLGNYQASLDEARKGLQAEPDYRPLKSFESRALYAAGEKDKAIQEFDEVLKKNPTDPYASLFYSRILADENRNADRAQNLARLAVMFGRISERPFINLSYVYARTGRFDLAFGAAQQAVQVYPNDAEALYYYGWTGSEIKKPGARESLEKAIALGLSGDQLKSARETLAKL